MATPGSTKQSILDLLVLAAPGWSPSPSSRRVRIPEGSPFAIRPPRRQPRPARTKRRTGGPFTTGVPCNPETGVGLLAAVVDPARKHLRVAEPLRAGARSILALTADRCCDGACDTAYCGAAPRIPFPVDESMLACKFCSRPMGGKTIYMYMDKGFCMPECRYKYFLEELYEQRRKLAAEARAGKRARRAAWNSVVLTEAEDKKFIRIFFTCVDTGYP